MMMKIKNKNNEDCFPPDGGKFHRGFGYTSPIGEILVLLNDMRQTITNTGIDKSLNREMLFRRFSRISGSADGNGLGLAIARQICLLYEWKIDYEYENQKHLFEVIF
ncbi:MAG: hypothetical protein LBL13_09440 [Bacteroidales bacterium]|nr:hypothetical protein [Bacteroidales bacterium]